LTTLTSHDILVIDTGSQLTDCGVNALLKGQPEEAILPIQDWGTVVNWMKAICQVIQNARYCNTIMLCHMLPVETYSGTGINKVLQKTEYFPMAGTQAFSRKFGAYFSTEIFLELRGNKHAGGSSTTYKKGVQTKSDRCPCRGSSRTSHEVSFPFQGSQEMSQEKSPYPHKQPFNVPPKPGKKKKPCVSLSFSLPF